MLEELFSVLPGYIVVGLFLSWIIWARFFNKEKSFKLKGEVENVFTILKIFFILFIGILGLILLIVRVILVLVKAYPLLWLTQFSTIKNILIGIFLFIIFAIVVCVNNKTTRKDFEKTILKIIFFLCCIAYVLFGISLAAFFSNYKYFLTMYLIFIFIFFNLLILWCILLLKRLLSFKITLNFWNEFKKYISKKINIKKVLSFIEKNSKKNILLLIFIALLFFISFIFFKWAFPQIDTTEPKEIKYIATENNLFMKKEITYSVKDIGKNFPFSDWIALDYYDINLSSFKTGYSNYINEKTYFNILYENGEKEQFKVIDLIDDTPKEKILISINESQNKIILRTNNDIFRRGKITNITLVYFVKIKNNNDNLSRRCNSKIMSSTLFVSCIMNNNLGIAIEYYDLFLFNVDNPYKSKNCIPEKANVDILVDTYKYNLSIDCNKESCVSNPKHRDDPNFYLDLSHSSDGKSIGRIYLEPAIKHTEITINVTLMCN